MVSFSLPFRSTLGRHFVGGIVAKIFLQTALIMAVIEGIFLAEKFSAIFDLGVNNHASLGEIWLLLLCSAPEILDLALAIAILVGVYRVLLRVREDRELLVMAGAGMGMGQVMGLLLGVAVVAQTGSLLISGTLGPASQYAQRVILFNAEYRILRDGGAGGQFYYFPSHVVFAGAAQKNTAARHLFIREELADANRVITANQATLTGPDARGRIALQLRDFLAYDFDNGARRAPSAAQMCPGCPALPSSAPAVVMRVRNFTQQFDLDQLLRFDPRGTDAKEWTLLELLGVARPPVAPGSSQLASLGDRVARSLLCLLAPLLACAAVALTSRRTQMLALPGACVALLALDLGATLLIGPLTQLGRAPLVLVLVTGAVVIFALVTTGIVRSQYALLRPALARP